MIARPCGLAHATGSLTGAERLGRGRRGLWLRLGRPLGGASLGAGRRSPLARLDEALGVAGELDGGEAEQHEPPLRRDREDAGDPVGAAEDPAEEGALAGSACRRWRRRRRRWPRPPPCARPSVTTSTSQNSAGERREVVAVVHVLLVDRQHRAAEPGDERRRWRRRSAGPARARCRSTARPPRCPAAPARSGPIVPSRIWITANDDEHEHDHGEREERLVVGEVPRADDGTRDPGALEQRGVATADPRELDHDRVEEEGEGQRGDGHPDAVEAPDRAARAPPRRPRRCRRRRARRAGPTCRTGRRAGRP